MFFLSGFRSSGVFSVLVTDSEMLAIGFASYKDSMMSLYSVNPNCLEFIDFYVAVLSFVFPLPKIA